MERQETLTVGCKQQNQNSNEHRFNQTNITLQSILTDHKNRIISTEENLEAQKGTIQRIIKRNEKRKKNQKNKTNKEFKG